MKETSIDKTVDKLKLQIRSTNVSCSLSFVYLKKEKESNTQCNYILSRTSKGIHLFLITGSYRRFKVIFKDNLITRD